MGNQPLNPRHSMKGNVQRASAEKYSAAHTNLYTLTFGVRMVYK